MTNDTNFALSRGQNLYVLSNFPISDSTGKTDVEKRLERVNHRLEAYSKRRAATLARITVTREDLLVKRNAYEEALDKYRTATDSNNSWLAYHDRRIEELTKEQAVYRLMNDIRLGKILPVVAETGNVANVTFS